MPSQAGSASAPSALGLLDQLWTELGARGVTYCHWKSNLDLPASLAGVGDLDLLVGRGHGAAFEEVLAKLGFKRVVNVGKLRYPAFVQYFALDEGTQRFVHLDVYFQIITGETLLKNYHLPIEAMLLSQERRLDGVRLPGAAAELVTLVCREMIKRGSLLERLMKRKLKPVYEDIAALLAQGGADYAPMLATWLPSVDPRLWEACLSVLQRDIIDWHEFRLARRLRRELSPYRRTGSVLGTCLKLRVLVVILWQRLVRRKGRQLASGGVVIAFIGPEATGKSTLAHAMTQWLRPSFDTTTAHLGKPSATWLSALPNFALPLLRQLAPRHKTSLRPEAREAGGEPRVTLLYALRLLLLAWDRRTLAVRLHRRAANGAIVFCDRYPTSQLGAMDSAKLRAQLGQGLSSRLINRLAAWERRLYLQIPSPYLVIKLTVPVEVAIQRNRERIKAGKESDQYVYQRHTAGVIPEFPRSSVIEVSTDQPQDQLLATLKQAIWRTL